MERPTSTLTRRALLGRAAALSASASLVACRRVTPKEPPMTARMPTLFLPHGGGPWPYMDDPSGGYRDMRRYMEGLAGVLPERPTAILMVSAHWEAAKPTVMTAPRPEMLYDYYGFPPETYEVKWPAPGAPELAGEVGAALERAGIQTGADATRGFDHGAFVPLALAYPKADVPTLQLSLRADLDPRRHVEIGRALEPLRRQGVLLIGSGMSYHNMQGFRQFMRTGSAGPMGDDARAFDDWLAESMLASPAERERRLVQWAEAPRARACHPREEHLLPLHVVAGAAGEDAASLPYRDEVLGARVSAVHFGA